MAKSPLLSVVVPVYNENLGLLKFHEDLITATKRTARASYEVIYCDDGSNDGTTKTVQGLCDKDSRIKLVKLSRNFGKESAMSAGIAAAQGQAVLTIDGDGQHPVSLIPDFVAAWRSGAQVVVGIRKGHNNADRLKRSGSKIFYSVFNKLAGQHMVPGSTDFRLIDRSVQQAFLTLKESGRITRGLIDWLGFKREYIYFEANARTQGMASYSLHKLVGLAADSFVSLTPRPLFLFGYLGVLITIGALILGLVVIVEQLILGDPLSWDFTGTAMLGILILFLVGIVLMSQGILSLYISRINDQSKQRPLYVIDYSGSKGIDEDAS